MSSKIEDDLKMLTRSVCARVLDIKQSDKCEMPLCRICLVKTNEVFSIFDTVNSIFNTKLSDLVMKVSPICIETEDNLPSNICKSCKQNLIVAYDFRDLSIKSDRLLRDEFETTVNTFGNDCDNAVKFEQERENYETTYEVKNTVDFEEKDHDFTGRSFECDTCTYRFPTESRLHQHISLIHKRDIEAKKIITVGKQHICNKAFDKAVCLLRHTNVHNPEGKPFECEICYQRFATEIACAHHQIIHNGIVENMSTQTEVYQIKCLICAKNFLKKEYLSLHMKTHKEEISMITRHNKTYDEKKIDECNAGGKTFSQAGTHIDHLNTHSGLKQHVCRICNKSFQQANTLRDHIRIHSGEQPYLCSECGKTFNNSGNLSQHLVRHTGLKPFTCNQCPSRFSRKADLKSHMQTHTGLKPYVCDECGSSFINPYSLSKHKRIHTGEKPYVCDTCSMRFNSSNHLKRHKRTHTGEKPYKCKYCERSFSQRYDLVKHSRSHVGDNTYSCDKCSAAFRLYGELKAHILTHFLEEKRRMIGEGDGESCSNNSGTIIIKNSDNVPKVVIKVENTTSGCDD